MWLQPRLRTKRMKCWRREVLGFRVLGVLGFRVFGVLGFGFWVLGVLGFRVQGFFWV